ncbi:NUDIX domain-containing protein [Arthrobacter zhaoxinii]|uniref:NUDIX domain-containing protein n=1 Tax=Arthrobacter zhaoxinii TaxID=2964616 RepID=A0ABY5YRK2_9MICC|nr:NUDIX domain-containing protein [Arthrobacter zhaoxinii]UWX97734.1 NUDIX domain-containing protein [Arthrobacter zhaoxinii]
MNKPLGTSSLLAYPRPSVAVDTAVLTVARGSICVLLVSRQVHGSPGWALPGTFLHERETLAQAVLRSLREKAGVEGRVPQQLHVFDDPERDDRGWVLSVAHVDAVPLRALESALVSDAVRLSSVTEDRELIAGLPYGQAEMVDKAVQWLRIAYRDTPDPGGLLEEPFTLKDLRDVHEAVAGEPLMRDTFRRQMEPKLVGTGLMSDGTRGRPSRLWRRRGEDPNPRIDLTN